MDALGRLSPRLRAVVDSLPLRQGMRVIEVGGAPGAAARAVAAIVGSAGRVLVVDRSKAGVALVERNCREEIARGVVGVHLSDVESLRLSDEEPLFDLVFACRVGVLDGRHPQRYDAALDALRIATVPGASLYVDTGDPLEEIALHGPDVP